jgi:hypothetical protein
MSSLNMISFIVWGGVLFNVGFIAGWCAGRRMLRRRDVEMKEAALPSPTPAPLAGLIYSCQAAFRHRRGA